MPGQGCKSCGQVFWGDGPYFDGLPKPQWAVNPGATRWGPMWGGGPTSSALGGGCPGTLWDYWESPLLLRGQT